MGQQDICDFLEQNPDVWYSTKELSQAMNRSIGSVTVCMRKLRKNHDVDYKPNGKKRGARPSYLYKNKE